MIEVIKSKIGVWCENFNVHQVLIMFAYLLYKQMKVIRASVDIYGIIFFSNLKKGNNIP